MTTKKNTFEENLQQLQQIVRNLEEGDVPLEKALAEFKNGVELTQKMQKELSDAKDTLAKLTVKESENE